MKSLALRWKITLVGVLPLMAFLAALGYLIIKNYSSYSSAKVTLDDLHLYLEASEVAHLTQMERASAVAYLSGNLSQGELLTAFQNTDIKIKPLQDHLLHTFADPEYVNKVKMALESYSHLRSSIENKNIPYNVVLNSYAEIVQTLMESAFQVAKHTHTPEIALKTETVVLLEEAKEKLGELKGEMAKVLADDREISEEKYTRLLEIYSGISGSVHSTALHLSDEGRVRMRGFQQSSEWRETEQGLETVLKNFDRGRFRIAPDKYSAAAGGALTKINAVLGSSKQSVVEETEAVAKMAVQALIWLTIGSLLVCAVLSYIVIALTRSINFSLKDVAHRLAQGSESVLKASEEIASTSTLLSEASVEQASSLQETVSSADEISAMVNRNAESAKRSAETSQKSNATAMKGQKNVERMLESIDEISDSNVEVMRQMEESNKKISEIVKVIQEIGQKTEVINDIVFQTKLLSFNASVEAARAGEHGKGFAVVAEEVGNLASMSGNAANQISTMLTEGITKVEAIVEETQSRLQHLMTNATQKVDQGKKTAQDCSESLAEIIQNIQLVNNLVTEISEASGEQALGVREITTAMSQLEQVTQQNSASAQKTSELSNQLREQSEGVDLASRALMAILEGKHLEESVPANVVPFRSSSSAGKPGSGSSPAAKPMKKKVSVAPKSEPKTSMKKAVGETPDWDDPRFEEV